MATWDLSSAPPAAYAKANKLWGDASDPDYVEPQYSEYEELDLGTVVPSIAGPKRPQDRILLSEAKDMFEKTAPAYETDKTVKDPVAVSTDFRGDFDIENGDVAIASITSCTNTSNPSVMIAAGLIHDVADFYQLTVDDIAGLDTGRVYASTNSKKGVKKGDPIPVGLKTAEKIIAELNKA